MFWQKCETDVPLEPGGLSRQEIKWASGLEEGGEKGLGSGEELVEGFGSVWDL